MNNKKAKVVALKDRKFERKSGVNKNAYSVYLFDDHHWIVNSPTYDDLIELIDFCIKVNGSYWVRSKVSDPWTVMGDERDAKREAFNKWLGKGLKSGAMVEQQTIEKYFSGITSNVISIGNKTVVEKVNIGSCPMIDNALSIPMGPPFVNYDNRRYLNKWEDTMLTGDGKNVKLGKLVLLMIYKCLCSGEQLHPDANIEAELLLEQIEKDEWSNLDFRFAINWLASLVQKPGINLVTNLWFCGSQQGVGKGTLVDIMKYILGHTVCGTLSVQDIERGWNDHLVGKQLNVINEFSTTKTFTKRGWDNWIKANTCETTLDITQRNTTPYSVINIGNWIMTTNEEDPIWLDSTDRRNHLIKTSDESVAVALAAAIRTGYVDKDPTAIASGFAWILERVIIDEQFIARAHINEFKANVIESSDSEIEEWLKGDMTIARSDKHQSSDLYEQYKSWCHINRPGKEILTHTMWGKQMSKSKQFAVQKERKNNGVYYSIGDSVIKTKPNMQDGADIVTKVVGDITVIEDFDVRQDTDEVYKLTPKQLMRAKLIALEAKKE